ncbi:MAG: prolyl oligopeptidase family serine peptidase [Candidatus Berkiella sp.]
MKTQNTLIPRHILFADPEKLMVKLSPDGQWVSYLAPYEGELNVWLAPVNDLAAAKPITHSQQPIKEHGWSSQGDYVLYICDEKGDENWQLHGFECQTGEHHCYTPKGANAKIIHQSQKKPQQILIGLNQRDRHYHDVYLLDLKNNRLECVFENNQYWEFIANDDLTLRLGIKITTQGGEYVDLSDHKTVIATVTQHDLFGLYFYPRLRLGLSADSKKLYLAQSLESNTSIVSQVELSTAIRTDLGGQEKADICDVLLDPNTKQPIAYAVNQQRKEWYSIDGSLDEDLRFLRHFTNGDIDITSQKSDNSEWLVAFVHDNGPIKYYIYQRSSNHLIPLFDSHEAFKDYTFTKMEPHLIKTRDGLKCVSYLSRPLDNKDAVPLVLMVHGGPNYRDFWGFNPIHQWLSNRGYAVLSINYRASTGFGKKHAMAGNGEWGRKIQDDLLDGVKWAIDQGITTKDQVAIMGRSFGGYATLMALTQTPEVFCCGIDIVGPSNLETMAAHFPPYWKAMQGIINGMMLGCDPETVEGKAFLASRSPIHSVDKITKPLLIGHGSNDVRVLQEESDQLVKAMQENGIPVTYAYFPDEGHQFMHPGNRMAFYALAEAFLGKILNGKVEPLSHDIETSMVVKVDDFGLRG